MKPINFFKSVLCFIVLTLSSNNIQATNEEQETKNRASQVFIVLSSELLFLNGYTDIALGNYYKLLQQTQDVKVAERATEIAIINSDTKMLKNIQAIWSGYGKETSAHLKELELQQAFFEKDYAYVYNNLENNLKAATPAKRSIIFNSLTSLVLENLSLSKHYQQIHTLATQYPDNLDASITDVIYSAIAKDKDEDKNTLQQAMQQLHRLSPQMDKRITAVLHLLNHIDDSYLSDFFSNLKPENYHQAWIFTYIEQFLSKKKYEEAFAIIQKALTVYPSTPLYTQAGYINALKQGLDNSYNIYFVKGYQLANSEQKNYVATFATSAALHNRNTSLAKYWLAKIENNAYVYDRLVMQSLIAQDTKDTALLKKSLQQIEKLPNLSGIIYQYEQYAKLKFFQITQSQSPHKTLKEITQLEKSINTHSPDLIDLKMNLLLYKGSIYFDKLHDYSNAEQAYQKAVDIDSNPYNLNSLGYVMLHSNSKNKHRQALAILQKAYTLDTQSPEIKDSLGLAYVLNNHIDEGLFYLEKAYQKIQSSEVAAHLIHALWLKDKKQEALNIIHTELNKNPEDPYIKDIIKTHRIPEKSPTQ